MLIIQMKTQAFSFFILSLFLTQAHCYSQTCSCIHASTEQACKASVLCDWARDRCFQKYKLRDYLKDNVAYCQQFLRQKCREEEHCSWIHDECVEFRPCETQTLRNCKDSSNFCTVGGFKCIPKASCPEYLTSSVCNFNQGLDKIYCYWDPVNKCQPVNSCDLLPQTLDADKDCRAQLPYCTYRKGGGCQVSFDTCEEHLLKEQCFSTKDQNQKCLWTENRCVESRCTNLLYTTDEQCTALLDECTSDGIQCVKRGLCEDAKTADACKVDKNGHRCVYYKDTCLRGVCSNAPIELSTFVECQDFASSNDCIPQQNGGCRIKPESCVDYHNQFFCDWGKCFWSALLNKCKIKDCQDAPLDFDASNCRYWFESASSKCVAKQGGGCKSLSSCNSIEYEEECLSDSNGNRCFWEDSSCMMLICDNLRYPKYSDDFQCGNKLKNCRYNPILQSCQQPSCSEMHELSSCKIDGYGQLCINHQICVKKTCDRASYSLNTHLLCEQFLVQCTVNVIETINGTFYHGCREKQPSCSQYLHKEQCVVTLGPNYQQCLWTNDTCVTKGCEHAPDTFNSVDQCRDWLPNCLLRKTNQGCVAKGQTCGSLNETTACSEGVNENTLCVQQGADCVPRTCENAPSDSKTHAECNKWLSTCIYNVTGKKCETIPDPPLGCEHISGSDKKHYTSHKECNLMNSQCTTSFERCSDRKNDCSDYTRLEDCGRTIDLITCKWDGTQSQCSKLECTEITVDTGKYYTHDFCQQRQNECTVNNYKRDCGAIQDSCSKYTTYNECYVSTDGFCTWSQSPQRTYNCRDRQCQDNNSAQTDAECAYYINYLKCQKQKSSQGCEQRPSDCAAIDKIEICNSTVIQSGDYCEWSEQDNNCTKKDSPDNQNIKCEDFSNVANQIDCKKVAKQCELSLDGKSCQYINCSSIKDETNCNKVILNIGTKCSWRQAGGGGGNCRDRQCEDNNQITLDKKICKEWLPKCTHKTADSHCKERDKCEDEKTQGDCAGAYDKREKKCYWNSNETKCEHITLCNEIKNPITHEDCYGVLKDCHLNWTTQTASQIPSTLCVKKSANCSDYKYEGACRVTSSGHKCSWQISDSTCVDYCSSFTTNRSLPDCDKIKCDYDATNNKCQNKQLDCNYATQNQCETPNNLISCFWNESTCQTRTCDNLKSSPQSEQDCSKWLAQCKYNQITKKCYLPYCQYAPESQDDSTKCSKYSERCFLSTSSAPGCEQLKDQCDSYKYLSQCQLSNSSQCYWSYETNSCKVLMCDNIDKTDQTHQGCESLSKECTVAVNQKGCTIKSQNCDEFQQQYQCHISKSDTLCTWDDGQCKTKSCRTAPIGTYTIKLCQSYFDKTCTVNSNATSCTEKLETCQEYTNIQCTAIDAEDKHGNKCQWFNSKCLVRECDQVFKLSSSSELTNEDCQSFDESCIIDKCREKLCEDFFLRDDTLCSMALPNQRCTTDGTKCVPRYGCDAALTFHGCTFDSIGRSCMWSDTDFPKCQKRICSKASKQYRTLQECEEFLEGCVPTKEGGCREMEQCQHAYFAEACTVDKEGQVCIWDPNSEECFKAECMPSCGDGILSIGLEECDDVNLIPYDGCYECKIHCAIGCLRCSESGCLECEEGWALRGNQICSTVCGDGQVVGKEECDDMNQVKFDGCDNCKFQCHEKCELCEEGACMVCSKGWSVSNQECAAECGDGLVVNVVEDCDDGNLKSQDGCSSLCRQEQNWQCVGEPSFCYPVNNPSIIIEYSLYRNEPRQEVILKFSQELKLKDQRTHDIAYYVGVEIEGALESIDYSYQIEPIVPASEELQEVKYMIVLSFKKWLGYAKLRVKFSKQLFVNQFEVPLTQMIAQQSIRTPQLMSEGQKQIAQSTNSFNELIVYILFAVSGVACLTGDLQLFWNLLDLLQHLSYLIYINIAFPAHLEMFFQIFKMVTIKPLMDFCRVDELIAWVIGSIPHIPAQGKMKAEKVNAYFFLNAKSFFFVMGSACASYSICLFLASEFVYKSLIRFVQHTKMFHSHRPKMAQMVFSFRRAIQKSLEYFHYSGLIRAFNSSQYHLNFSALMQIKSPNFSDLNSSLNVIAAYLALAGQCASLSWIYSKLRKDFRNENSSQYKILLEDVKDNYWAIHYKPLVMTKKVVYMFCIVVLQEYPQAQVFMISTSSGLFLAYVIAKQPLESALEFNKVVLSEFCFAFSTISFLAYELESVDAMQLGWIHIGAFSMILSSHLILDLIGQITKLLKSLKSRHYRKESFYSERYQHEQASPRQGGC